MSFLDNLNAEELWMVYRIIMMKERLKEDVEKKEKAKAKTKK